MALNRLLVDGDLIVYWMAHRHQEVTEWDDELISVHMDMPACIADFEETMEYICTALAIKRVLYAFSCPSSRCFRKEIYPEYKENRSTKNIPVGYSKLKAHIMENHPYKLFDRLEADDVIAIEATDPNKDCEIVDYILSADKDYRQLGVPMINPYQLDAGVLFTDNEEATRLLYSQILSGDRADNFFGCPGIGPVTAKKVLAKCETEEEMWEATVKAFEKKGLSEADATLYSNLVYLLRHENYNQQTGEITLWDPSSKKLKQ